jgi:hypothetical protein
MPKVPTSNNVVPGPGPQGQEPSETMYMMAAAMMHQEGRLFDQPRTDPTKPNVRSLKGVEKEMEKSQKEQDKLHWEDTEWPKAKELGT